jgi:hypothetical protein
MFRARSINPLERGRPVCGGRGPYGNSMMGRSGGSPRPSARVHHVTPGVRRLVTVKKYGEKGARRSWKKRVIRRQGKEVRTVARHAKNPNWRECFHAATVTTGGARSWISAAVSRSITFIGPAHFGQRQRSEESLVEEPFCSACGCCAEPRR